MNKIFQFWQELKRRKVVRRNTVYAASAFVILEFVSIIQEPLNLPAWVLTLVFIILCIGLVISLIVSWIFDVNPEGGLEKTKPAESGADPAAHVSTSAAWKFATYASVVVIIVLIILNVIPRVENNSSADSFEKSIAVLPFQYLSSDSSQVYFCDAIREEILNHLDKVQAFSVRSRTSTDPYRNTNKNIKTIGEELNVNYLVEGSVGLEDNQLKIWIQLIGAQTDEHIWSEGYTRQKRQIFSIQRDIAKTIAQELKTTLSPEEIEKIEHTPTENTEAYQTYLRGRYYANQPHYNRENWDQALHYFQQAVEIDTGFALAYSQLARGHALYRNLRWDLSESRVEKADAAAEKALALGNDIPEVHLAIGYYYMHAHRNWKKKDEHWRIAEKGLPNNIEILKARSEGLETQGKWEESLELLEKAATLNPNNADTYSDMGFTLWWLRRYDEAVTAFEKAITLSPKEVFPYILLSYTIYSWMGPNEHSREALTHVGSNNGWYLFMQYWQEVGEGNFEAALELLSGSNRNWAINQKAWTRPRDLLVAYIYDHLGNQAAAEENYRAAANFLEKKIIETPSNPMFHSSLGIAYAGLMQKEKALNEMKLALELLPLEKDGIYGVQAEFDLAVVYTMLNEFDLAIEQVHYLLSFPNFMSTSFIDWDIRLLPLKSHSRYTELHSE